MRRTAAALIMTLLITAAAGTILVNLAAANPYFYEQVPYQVPPPSNVKPPTVTIHTPVSDATYISSNATLTFNVNLVVPDLPELFYYYIYLSEVRYKASWLANSTNVDLGAFGNILRNPNGSRTWDENSHVYMISGYEVSPDFSINLTSIPDGNNSIEVFAVLRGSCKTSFSPPQAMTIYYGRYELIGSASVNFTTDSIAVLSPLNQTYSTADVPLLLRLYESAKQIEFSLDGQEKVTVAGNTTLTGLSNGNHNLTVFTTDNNGNAAASAIIYFTVDAPFPTVPVVAVSAASIAAVACAGLILTRRKRRKEAQQT